MKEVIKLNDLIRVGAMKKRKFGHRHTKREGHVKIHRKDIHFQGKERGLQKHQTIDTLISDVQPSEL